MEFTHTQAPANTHSLAHTQTHTQTNLILVRNLKIVVYSLLQNHLLQIELRLFSLGT